METPHVLHVGETAEKTRKRKQKAFKLLYIYYNSIRKGVKMKNLKKSLTKGFTIKNFKRSDGAAYQKLQYSFWYEGKRLYVYGDSAEECLLKAEKKISTIKNKDVKPDNEITLKEFFEEVIQRRLDLGQIRKSTAHNRRTLFNARISDTLGDKKLIEITTRELIDLQVKLAKRITTSGTNATMSLIKDIYSQAVRDGIITIDKNPAINIKALKRRDDEIKAKDSIHRELTQEELDIFLSFAKNSHYYELFRLLAVTGMRVGEATALRRNDILVKERKIVIDETVTRTSNTKVEIGKPKTSAGNRKIELTEQVEQIIKSQLEKNRVLFGNTANLDGSDLIFKDTRGEIIDEQHVLSCMRQIFLNIQNSGIVMERFTPHAFRSSYISRAARSGMNIKTLMTLVGHSDMKQTIELYTHVNDLDIESASRLVNIAV